MSKIAISNTHLVADLSELARIDKPRDQQNAHCLEKNMSYKFYSDGISHYCILCQGRIPHGNDGHWYEDYILFLVLFEQVEDDYDFEANDATDVTESTTERERRQIAAMHDMRQDEP